LIEIFLIQLLAAALGALSTALADWSYNKGRIGPRLHTFWLSSSIAAICSPVVGWISNIFFGSGVIGRGVAGLLVGAIFFWVYHNLPKPRSVQKRERTCPCHPRVLPTTTAVNPPV
jgi:hypothetical protein